MDQAQVELVAVGHVFGTRRAVLNDAAGHEAGGEFKIHHPGVMNAGEFWRDDLR